MFVVPVRLYENIHIRTNLVNEIRLFGLVGSTYISFLSGTV